MALDVWFRDDVERLLRALALSGEVATGVWSGGMEVLCGREREVIEAYRAGYRAALIAVAKGFGLGDQIGEIERLDG